MPLATTINLPRGVEPRWPDRCIVCRRETPGATVSVCTASIGLHTLLTGGFGRLYWARVPACRGCGRRLWAGRVFRIVITLGLLFVGVTIALWVLGRYDGPLRRPLGIGIALGSLLPYFMLEAFFPPVFDMTAMPKKVDYEFRDATYAADFESLNREQMRYDEAA